jgi:WhiB family redox-sensing transcriptional regulator
MTYTKRLPKPVAEEWDWQLHGSCRSLESAVFFHPDNERGPARRTRQARAKQICGGCPVLMECREHALRTKEPFGVWGGLDEDERRAIFSRRPRQRERQPAA